MYCKLAVEAKLHFHINSDIMNSIVLITWVAEVLLLLLLLLPLFFFFFFFFFFFSRAWDMRRELQENRHKPKTAFEKSLAPWASIVLSLLIKGCLMVFVGKAYGLRRYWYYVFGSLSCTRS